MHASLLNVSPIGETMSLPRVVACISIILISMLRPNLADRQDLLLIKPNALKYIAHEGVTFTNMCCPSRTELITRRAFHNIKQANRYGTDCMHIINNAQSLFQLFHGKFYCVHDPFLHGFSLVNAPCKFNDFYGTQYMYYDEDMCTHSLYNITLDIGNTSLSLIATHEKPLIAWIGLHSPHCPTTPAAWYSNKLQDEKVPLTTTYNIHILNHNDFLSTNPPMNANVSDWVDQFWRNRLRSLLSIDDLDNTYVMFTSDHGYCLGQLSVQYNKMLPYDTDIRIPIALAGIIKYDDDLYGGRSWYKWYPSADGSLVPGQNATNGIGYNKLIYDQDEHYYAYCLVPCLFTLCIAFHYYMMKAAFQYHGHCIHPTPRSTIHIMGTVVVLQKINPTSYIIGADNMFCYQNKTKMCCISQRTRVIPGNFYKKIRVFELAPLGANNTVKVITAFAGHYQHSSVFVDFLVLRFQVIFLNTGVHNILNVRYRTAIQNYLNEIRNIAREFTGFIISTSGEFYQIEQGVATSGTIQTTSSQGVVHGAGAVQFKIYEKINAIINTFTMNLYGIMIDRMVSKIYQLKYKVEFVLIIEIEYGMR
eukprot:737578_1